MSNDLNNTLSERGNSYGDFTDNAFIAQQLKDVVRCGRAWVDATAAQREAVDMILSKISRLVTGNPYHKDSWHDIQGYAKLAEDRVEVSARSVYAWSDFTGPFPPFPPLNPFRNKE